MSTSSIPPIPPTPPQVPSSLARSVLSEELEQLLEFNAKENEKYREFFEHLYKMTAGALTVIFVCLAAIVGFFGWKTLGDIRNQAKAATDAAIADSRKQISEVTSQQIIDLRKQISERVNTEFQTPAIRGTVLQVASQQTRDVLMPVINKEVRSQVTTGVQLEQQQVRGALLEEVHKSVEALQPTIQESVNERVKSAVDPAVQARVESQVDPKLRQLEAAQKLSSLVTGTETGDARAFDQLYMLAISPQTPSRDQEVALNSLRAATEKYNPIGLYQTRQFLKPKAEPELVTSLRDADPWSRKAAVDSLGLVYWKKHMDELFTILTSDDNLVVREAAFYYFDTITQSHVTPLIVPGEMQWWIEHRKEFVEVDKR